MFYRLVRTDQGTEESWRLVLPTTVGRGSDQAVCIQDESISRAHCQLYLGSDESLKVRDLGSTNGTYVNGERISHPHSLVPGDILQVGAINLQVEYKSDTDPGRPVLKKPKISTSATQPMRTIPKQTVQESREAGSQQKRWWEFWKQ